MTSGFSERELADFVDMMSCAAEMTAGGKPMSEGAARLMFTLLREDLTLDEIKAGILAHLKTSNGRFMPTIADIRSQAKGTEDERGQLAWRFFKKSFECYGFYDSVKFPNPAYHYAIEQLGGWTRIGKEWHDLTEKEIEFRAKDFIRLYLIGERVASWYAEHGKVKVSPYMAGFFELDNTDKNFTRSIPEVIDAETGKQIDRGELLNAFSSHALNDYGLNLELSA